MYLYFRVNEFLDKFFSHKMFGHSIRYADARVLDTSNGLLDFRTIWRWLADRPSPSR